MGFGGGGTIEDVTVRGGEVGLKIQSSQWALRGITLRGAESVGLLCNQNTNVQFVDIEISDTPLAVNIAAGSSYVILDARFNAIGNGTAIRTNGHPLFSENVTTDSSVKSLVDGGPATLPAAKAFWQGVAYLGGAKSSASHGLVAASRMRRESRPRPTFESAAEPANVLRFGAKGDGIHDDTEAFKQAIAASEVVFVPWGLFRVTDTLLLRSNTKIVGEGLSHIWLGNNSAGFDDPTHPKPLILAPDDPAAEVWLADLRIYCGSGNSGAVSVHWMAGSASGIWDVHMPFYLNAQARLFHLDKQGGVRPPHPPQSRLFPLPSCSARRVLRLEATELPGVSRARSRTSGSGEAITMSTPTLRSAPAAWVAAARRGGTSGASSPRAPALRGSTASHRNTTRSRHGIWRTRATSFS